MKIGFRRITIVICYGVASLKRRISFMGGGIRASFLPDIRARRPPFYPLSKWVNQPFYSHSSLSRQSNREETKLASFSVAQISTHF
uniref:Uncharacterized protein n=1 Tax=Heterorhabditis bacteriophora TaxID=37862 RepID=A0A1I7W9M9_HETBA